MILVDYHCESCGDIHERMVESPAPEIVGCEYCDQPARWLPSAVFGRVKSGEVVRGKSDERPPGSVMLDTRPLADGMPQQEWSARQSRITRERMWRRGKKALGG